MKVTTQAQALAAIEAIGDRISGLLDRFESGGAAVAAQAAQEIAAQHRERAATWRQVRASGRKPAAVLLAIAAGDAAQMDESRARTWAAIATDKAAEADRIARVAAQVFAEDGMTYVAGRGRVRAL